MDEKLYLENQMFILVYEYGWVLVSSMSKKDSNKSSMPKNNTNKTSCLTLNQPKDHVIKTFKLYFSYQ